MREDEQEIINTLEDWKVNSLDDRESLRSWVDSKKIFVVDPSASVFSMIRKAEAEAASKEANMIAKKMKRRMPMAADVYINRGNDRFVLFDLNFVFV